MVYSIKIIIICFFLIINTSIAKSDYFTQGKNFFDKKEFENLKRGDKVITSGGIIGTVERVMENDKAEIQISDDVKVEIVKSTGIQGLLNTPEPKK